MTFKEFWSNIFVKNILLALVLFIVSLIAVSFFLDFITNHNKEYEVPDMTNIPLAEAKSIATKNGFRVEVVDSVYVRRMGRGLVYRQNPNVGSKVKKGRRILLTINSVVPKKVQMPDLVGYSMRQAKAELISRGLMLGKLIYVDDIATNNVIKQLYNNREIKPGRPVVSGTKIDLVVGLNPSDDQTYVPNVVGMKYLRAIDVIYENSLNVGTLRFNKNVKNYSDSLDAVVVSQTPEGSELPVLMGSNVSIRLEKKKN